MSKQVIKSLKIDGGAPVEPLIRKACERMKDTKDIQATREGRTSDFSYEIIQTFENIRVNVYNATDADLFWLGVNYQNAYHGKL